MSFHRFALILALTTATGLSVLAQDGTLVDLGTHKLNIVCSGAATARPVVILEAGGGGSSGAWKSVQAALPTSIRTCAYDRAGSGKSDPGPESRTMEAEAADLHALVERSHIPEPIVLVGQSVGGIYARLYVRKYRGAVAGMLLIDPTEEHDVVFNTKLKRWITVMELKDAVGDAARSLAEARQTDPVPLGNLPLIVIGAGKRAQPPGTSEAQWLEMRSSRDSHVKELSKLSTNSKFILDPTSGHNIEHDNPKLVAEAIQELVDGISLSGERRPHSPGLDSWQDPSSHSVQFVDVAQSVRLEVLDWGGTGRPVVLLAGGGNTAHVYDEFATKLTARYHVYGITRRGFGASGFSATDNPADRLGDDVVAVIDTLKLDRPVLVGHSLAGVELSSVANRHPDRIAGLVYLDAAYSYAFDNGKGADVMEMQRLKPPGPPPPGSADRASFSAFTEYNERINGFRFPEAELRQEWTPTPTGEVGKQRNFPGAVLFMPLLTGTRKYISIPVPALVIFANPHRLGVWVNGNTDPTVRTAAESYSSALAVLTERQAKAVEIGVPTAHVVRLPGANHHVFLSNEADVIREMRSFLNTLK